MKTTIPLSVLALANQAISAAQQLGAQTVSLEKDDVRVTFTGQYVTLEVPTLLPTKPTKLEGLNSGAALREGAE